ncbi:ribosome-inactivating family protein [Streptomyces griseorubiginosus]|uniref:ribosome-inactivating family protein n=1 Tax=Streptomyces griseorubiginosus TaxID=67304 RepID=UPI00366187E1
MVRRGVAPQSPLQASLAYEHPSRLRPSSGATFGPVHRRLVDPPKLVRLLGTRDANRASAGHVAADREWPTGFGENYMSLERAAGQTRAGLRIDRGTINGALWNLYRANDPRDMARGVLMMTQVISEAARFRPLRDEIALRLGPEPQDPLYLRQQYADQENNWSSLSSAFSNLMRQPEGTDDNTPMEGWGRISEVIGRPIHLVLTRPSATRSTCCSPRCTADSGFRFPLPRRVPLDGAESFLPNGVRGRLLSSCGSSPHIPGTHRPSRDPSGQRLVQENSAEGTQVKGSLGTSQGSCSASPPKSPWPVATSSAAARCRRS